jgi:hypothetical protein
MELVLKKGVIYILKFNFFVYTVEYFLMFVWLLLRNVLVFFI